MMVTGRTEKPEKYGLSIQVVSVSRLNCIKVGCLHQEYKLFQDRWYLVALVLYDRFHCTILCD